MRIGWLLLTISVLLTTCALRNGQWFLVLLWPAANCLIVASGYLAFGPAVFAKSADGRMPWYSVMVLLPYLSYSHAMWHVLQLLGREPAWHELTDQIVIGRRLLSHEVLENVDHVVDLTCEFTEPPAMRNKHYHCYQILDASVPRLTQLRTWIEEASEFRGRVYIHCAQGHGRTGMFVAALLLYRREFATARETLEFIQSKRPLVRLTESQQALLSRFERELLTSE